MKIFVDALLGGLPRRFGALLAALLLAGCAAQPGADPAAAPAAAASTPAAAAPPPVLPFDEAVLSAADALLGKAQLPDAAAGAPSRLALVIDPLIDGLTGAQSQATRAMGARIERLIRERYPRFEVQPFSALNVARSPLVLIGTFTGVDNERKAQGVRESYRICLALADLKTGKLVGKGLAFARPDGVDATPTPFFRDSPAWTEDPATQGYVRTCQGTRAGDPIHPLYADRIVAAALLAEAIDAYGAGRYADALALYQGASKLPAGRQLRTWSGLYLANWKLGRRAAAAEAFGQIVDDGLESKRLGVKFLFRPGAATLQPDAAGAPPQQLWLTTLSSRAARRAACLEVTGHTSRSGPEPANERLSLLRAQHVKSQLERGAATLDRRLVANGVGSRETLVGNGRDDLSDALDRRVEFKVVPCA